MSPAPSPGQSPEERRELRDALLTFVPAVLVAFALERALTALWEWPSRRAWGVAVGVGIVLALALQRVLARRGRS